MNRGSPKAPSNIAFYIWSRDYTTKSSGVRCLYLLCHHLNRLGYKAFVTGSGAPPELDAPTLNPRFMQGRQQLGLQDIFIYPDVISGNPLGGRNVVRYLLNKMGKFEGHGVHADGKTYLLGRVLSVDDYGPNDFFIHFAEEFRNDDIQSFRMSLPLTDRSVYKEKQGDGERNGFVIFSNRYKPDLSTLPDWVSPYTLASMENLRSPEGLAALYQTHAALVIWERSAAITEAIHCGCPVIMIPRPTFDHRPMVDRFGGNGCVVGWDIDDLPRAQQTVSEAVKVYWQKYQNVEDDVQAFVDAAMRHFFR